MLLSQREERGRRFSLALRSGIPILILIFLVFYTTISKNSNFSFDLESSALFAAITFVSIYFIYFLMNLSVQETILDHATQSFNKKTFIKKLYHCNPQILACLNIQNLQSINENYSSEQIDGLLYVITQKLNFLFKQHGLGKVILGKNRDSEFLIAINKDAISVQIILEKMLQENSLINEIEIDYRFAIISNTNQDFEKIILQLRDIIQSQTTSKEKKTELSVIQDAEALSSIEKDIIQSLQSKNFILSFRPILNVHDSIIDTYEIASKLKTSSGEDILPRVFLPIINRLGLGRDYDLALMKNIIDILALVDENISFTFNLSPFSLRDKSFQEEFFSYLDDKKADPNRLIIQLYERKTHHDLSSYLQILKNFRAKGVQICIDNFGSSNASMEYIKHFKFDMVQFDRDYVAHLDNDTTYAMLGSLIRMSKDLQIQTAAKWVDSDEQKSKLKKLGIDYMQGFGISTPLNKTELINRYNQKGYR